MVERSVSSQGYQRAAPFLPPMCPGRRDISIIQLGWKNSQLKGYICCNGINVNVLQYNIVLFFWRGVLHSLHGPSATPPVIMTLYFHLIPCSQNWNWTLHGVSVLQPLYYNLWSRPSTPRQSAWKNCLQRCQCLDQVCSSYILILEENTLSGSVFAFLENSRHTLPRHSRWLTSCPSWRHHNSRAWWGPLRPSRLLSFSIRSTAPGRATAPLWSTPNLSGCDGAMMPWCRGLRHP